MLPYTFFPNCGFSATRAGSSGNFATRLYVFILFFPESLLPRLNLDPFRSDLFGKCRSLLLPTSPWDRGVAGSRSPEQAAFRSPGFTRRWENGTGSAPRCESTQEAPEAGRRPGKEATAPDAPCQQVSGVSARLPHSPEQRCPRSEEAETEGQIPPPSGPAGLGASGWAVGGR